MRIRIATYNVHKCRGMDRRTDPARIAAVLRLLDADVIGLQEILDVRDGLAKYDQARTIADAMEGYQWCFGENRRLLGGSYGNMILSRLPIAAFTNYDLSHRKRERRGCLRANISPTPEKPFSIFNVHLGTGFMERRHQARRFIRLLETEALHGPRVVFGDFNEWTRGLTSQGLSEAFETFTPQQALGQARTYPGLMPILHLDHFYYDPAMRLQQMHLVRTSDALLASDHLPLVGDFLIGS